MKDRPPETVAAMQLIGHGDVDQLQYRADVATPQVGPNQVLQVSP